MPKIRIHNITSFLPNMPRGFGLDFEGKYIPANPERPLITELAVIPQLLEEWQAKRWVKIQDADNKTPVTKESEAAVTPGTGIDEAKASRVDQLDDSLDEDIFDFSIAKEAALTDIPEKTGPVPLQSISQVAGHEEPRRAKVTLGSEDRMNLADTVSPIPGDRPVSIDNSEAFTVRAPRHTGPGAVVKS